MNALQSALQSAAVSATTTSLGTSVFKGPTAPGEYFKATIFADGSGFIDGHACAITRLFSGADQAVKLRSLESEARASCTYGSLYFNII